MGSIIIKLRQSQTKEWALFAPAGHQLSNIFKGTSVEALEWARAWCSSYSNWAVQLDGDTHE